MQKGNDHVALMCTKVLNKNDARPWRGRLRKGRRESIMCLIVVSLPGLDLQ